mmetsp:Transcript_20882/g.68982  ORF Transcript_20882/g.68982 Transcript_20882/m.68982 type:complete len:510 (+) Transcript_20882:106-1635(+)
MARTSPSEKPAPRCSADSPSSSAASAREALCNISKSSDFATFSSAPACASGSSRAGSLSRLTAWPSACFWRARSRIFSSTDAFVTKRKTRTGLVWPSRCARSVACRSICGFQSGSKRTTASAVARLMPTPPARVEIRYAKWGEPGALNSRMSSSRWMRLVEPSIRRCGPKARQRRKSSSRSSVCVKEEKRSTREPFALSRCSKLSRTASLPEEATSARPERARSSACASRARRSRSSSLASSSSSLDSSPPPRSPKSTKGISAGASPPPPLPSPPRPRLPLEEPGTRGSRMRGWLHTLRSCVMMICSCEVESSDCDSRSRSSSRAYQRACRLLIGHDTSASCLGGSVTTSALSRRSMKGASKSRAFAMRSVSATSLPVSKPASNWSEVVKREGRRKRSSAQSSWRLFWSGVPVMSSRKFARTRERPMCSLEASFLRLCASSTMRADQQETSSVKKPSAALKVSYVVMKRSYSAYTTSARSRSAFRSCAEPCSLKKVSSGVKRLHSFAQF